MGQSPIKISLGERAVDQQRFIEIHHGNAGFAQHKVAVAPVKISRSGDIIHIEIGIQLLNGVIILFLFNRQKGTFHQDFLGLSGNRKRKAHEQGDQAGFHHHQILILQKWDLKFDFWKIDFYYCGMLDIEVVLSPALLHLTDVKHKNVVVIDILRATSTICTAIHEGALSVKPVSTVDEALILKNQGYLIAGERDGYKIEGFDMGNSPFECMDGKVKGERLALTTTNGTKCITAASTAGASNVLSGSFLNIDAISEWLIKDNKDIVLLCAGWKDKVNLEDSVFAGALTARHINGGHLNSNCDSAHMALDIYRQSKNNISEYLVKSSHYQRLSHLHHQEDMIYCLKQNIFDTVVGLKGGEMLKIN